MAFFGWKPYVPVAARKAKAQKKMAALCKKGMNVQPVELAGRTIASSFWGKGWCDHLESFSDYDNRLPRGRTYVRNGSVCHLEILPGRIEAYVSGSKLYKVAIEIKPLAPEAWKKIQDRCRGGIGSMLELLQGKLSNQVMSVVSDRKQGLFPQPGEIKLQCSCPDWATMCKHVAAVLYGVGSRLDQRPELLFVLRQVDAQALIAAKVALPKSKGAGDNALAEEGLGALFGIELDDGGDSPLPAAPAGRAKPIKKAAPKKTSRTAEAPAKMEPPPMKTRTTPPFNEKKPTGAGIIRLRKHAGLSTADFARELGLSEASILRWENSRGALRLQAATATALASFQKKLLDR